MAQNNETPRRKTGVELDFEDADDALQNLTLEEIENMPSGDLEEMQHLEMQSYGDVEKQYKTNVLKTIERKYFKSYLPKEPNLLTWAMREQLRYLHELDPEKWTPEVLSESFPISSDGVKKLLKARWVPESQEDIEKHDRRVLQRWKKLTKGRPGSASLLSKALGKAPSNQKELVAATETLPPEFLAKLKGLHFEGEEAFQGYSAARPQPATSKKKGLKLPSFVNIITDYNRDVEEIEHHRSADGQNCGNSEHGESLQRCKDLDIVTRGPLEYPGPHSAVSLNNNGNSDFLIEDFSDQHRRRKKGKSKLITFDEFMNAKKKKIKIAKKSNK